MSARRSLVQAASADGMFLARLPDDARQRLLAETDVIDARRGTVVFSADEPADRVGIVAAGIARTFLTVDEERRLSVRYVRTGQMIGSITTDRAHLSVQAVSDCTILEIAMSALHREILADGRVGLAVIAEVSYRLQDTYATLASNTLGSMRERVARHLLDLSTDDLDGEGPAAAVTQQGLADAVGTVREVVARVLRDLRTEGLVATAPGHIRILDPDRLAAIIGRDRAVVG